MRGRALIAAGSTLIVIGLFVLSPAIWVLLDQLFQQLFGAPLIGVVLGGGGLIVPLILTSLGTAGIVGGAWMIANGSRRRREHARGREQNVRDQIAREQAMKPAEEPMDGTSLGE